MHEWEWDKEYATTSITLFEQNLSVQFHGIFSNGTSAVRGTKLLEKGRHHYWELKILTPTYGTDIMIGVGTDKVDMNSRKNDFCSFLGLDQESFGFSYRGYIQYDGKKRKYGCCFDQDSLVGVHLNTWNGTLEFFHNRKSLGIAFTGLKDTMLYPMMECLTALKSSQREYLLKMFPGLCYLFENIFADILKADLDDSDDDDDDNLNPLMDYTTFDDYFKLN
ncbi:SPRY domain-containing SOCS box protein 3 isoform X2 [Nomia melanderi]|uniref:SPRY domain-containing SOCS box protein 3 isoform X2 n=1 Tax=Nomia melanderi TaxID=2448451 RepID=UPI0013043293|nr:SPRY domain-containing SOCS box protein 3-like isoform X2 [Nomia melanderi]